MNQVFMHFDLLHIEILLIKKKLDFFFFNLDTWATFQENHVRNSNFFRYDWIGEKKYYNSQVHKILYALWPSIESKGNQTSLLGISLIT